MLVDSLDGVLQVGQDVAQLEVLLVSERAWEHANTLDEELEEQRGHVEVGAARPEAEQVGWLMLEVVFVTAQGALVRKRQLGY